MKKILFIFGTRPEAIKIAPVYKRFSENKNFKTYVCITSQHKKMLNEVIKIFNIKVDFNLNIMKKNQNISYINIKILKKLGILFQNFKPDLVLVHGDTTTTFTASLSAFYNNIKVAHIEAGLRSFNLNEPYPEEFNRKVTSIICDLHFAPTIENKKNLIKEGIDHSKVIVTGNTVIDSVFYLNNLSNNNINLKKKYISKLRKVTNFNIQSENYILVTCHRRENFGNNLIQICEALISLSKKYKNFFFVYPVHLNPNVKNIAEKKLSGFKNIVLIKPQNYINFYFLLKYCYFIITDSGGIQEEAPSLNKPILVIRNVTERKEIIINQNGILTGTSKKNIVTNTSILIENSSIYKKMAFKANPYGNGYASEKIFKKIVKYLN